MNSSSTTGRSSTYDVLVVGGGPAGMAAATTAAAHGLATLLVDERPTLGGQVYKQPGPGMLVTDAGAMGKQYRAGRVLIDATYASGAEVQLDASVVAMEQRSGRWVVMISENSGPVSQVAANRVIVAAGAYDRPVAFPGWTLPGVMTAGGLQTLAKTQGYVPGQRVVFAGSGPVALAFPAQLAGYGARIVAAFEAGPSPSFGDFARIGAAATGNFSLLMDALQYRTTLLTRRIPLRYQRVVVRVEGSGRVERVVHARVDENWRVLEGTEEQVEADILCVGYGFTPSTELLRLIGCDFDHDEDRGGAVVRMDEWGRTSVPGVFAAGDGAGVEGSAVAVEEGRLAALGAAIDAGAITIQSAETTTGSLLWNLRRRRALAHATQRMYKVGDGLFELADPGTIVCRCESVSASEVKAAACSAPDVSSVKALTRAGMGLCQGRMCGRQVAAIVSQVRQVPAAAIPVATPRMPARPTAIGAIADEAIEDPGLFVPKDDEKTERPYDRAVPADLVVPTSNVIDTDVVVIGGGIAGAAVAYYLANEGVEVDLLERGELNREASGTNAGSFHFQLAIHQLSGRGTEADRSRLLSDARDSVEAYGLWKTLGRELGADLGLHQTGGWMVAETPEQLAILREKHILEAEAGIETEVITGASLQERAPFFSPKVLGASYCGLEGHANPLVVAPIYADRAQQRKARIRTHTEVLGIDVLGRGGSHRFSVKTNHGTIRAQRVVNCAGGWAGEVAEMVGLQFPIRREGLHVNVTESRPPLLPAMVQHIGRRLTLKQSAHGQFIIGGGWPTGTSAYPARYPTEWKSAAGNLAVALDIVPALRDVRIIRTWSGIIAFTDDFSPIVGESTLVPGFFACVSTTGFTFSPAFAHQLVEQMLDKSSRNPFPERFSLDRATT